MAYTFAKRVVGLDFRGISFGSSFSAEAIALFDVMDTPPSGARATAYNDYIQALKDNDIWDNLGALYIPCSEAYNDSHINILTPDDLDTYTELAGTIPSSAAAWVTNVGLLISGQGQVFGYHRTKWAQNAMPGFNRDTVCYGVMQTGSVHPQQSVAWAVDSGNAGTILSLGFFAGSTRGNISHTAATLGNQSSSVVDGYLAGNAMVRGSSTTVDHSINGGAFQHIGATAKGVNTAQETNKLAFYNQTAAADNQRFPILFAFKSVTPARIAAMNSLSKTFLNAIGVFGWTFAPETVTLLNAMGSPPNDARKTLIDNLITDLIDAGVWDKLGVFYVLAAHIESAALLNWKNPSFGLLANQVSMAFTVDGGFTGNGQINANASYLLGPDFNTVPVMTQNSGHLSVYATSEGDGQGGGVFDARNFNEFPGGDEVGKIAAKSVLATSDGFGYINGSAAMSAAASSVVRGQYLANRSGAIAAQFYRDGVESDTDTTASTALVSSNFSIGASFIGFTWGSRQPRVGACSIGGSLTAPEASAFYTALNDYLTAVGAIP